VTCPKSPSLAQMLHIPPLGSLLLEWEWTRCFWVLSPPPSVSGFCIVWLASPGIA
jgi:hypothetical protein